MNKKVPTCLKFYHAQQEDNQSSAAMILPFSQASVTVASTISSGDGLLWLGQLPQLIGSHSWDLK